MHGLKPTERHGGPISTALFTSVNEHRLYESVSPEFARLLGYTPEELRGKRVDDITAPHTLNIHMVFEALQELQEMEGLWLFQHREGKKVLLHFHAAYREDQLICVEFKPLTIVA